MTNDTRKPREFWINFRSGITEEKPDAGVERDFGPYIHVIEWRVYESLRKELEAANKGARKLAAACDVHCVENLKLRKERDALREHLKNPTAGKSEVFEVLIKERDTYRAALEFYAKGEIDMADSEVKGNLEGDDCYDLFGVKARDVLAKYPKESE